MNSYGNMKSEDLIVKVINKIQIFLFIFVVVALFFI